MRLRSSFVLVLGCLALVGLACTPPKGGGGTTTVPSGAPVAVAGAVPSIGDAPLPVQFNSAGSTPGTGTGLTYTWTFGDGTPDDTTSGASATHVYEEPGTYTAKLTMTNSKGSDESPGIQITVNVDPNPKFYVKPTGSTGAQCGPKADPCSTIVEAQSNAVVNDIHTIRVAGGTYSQPLSLASDMDITGGWKQDFSDFGPDDVTTILGSGTEPAVTVNGVSDSAISGVSAQGIVRTSGNATGIVVTGGSTGVKIGDIDSPDTLVGGGEGPNATGILVDGGSLVNVENVKVNSGITTGAGSSAYGIRALGLSVVNVTLSEVTGQPGVPGVNAPGGTPAQAAAGCNGLNGSTASAGYNNGGWGGAGCASGGVRNGGNGGRGGSWDYSFPWWNYWGGDAGASGGGGAAGGAGGCGSATGCGGDAGGGRAGAAGAAGNAGAAGSNAPVAGDLWTSTNGTPGTAGQPGGGGGGGGGGKSASANGGGGGGGAGGGAGGAAGTVAGTSGGGSFGVYANSASVNLSSSTATSSAGGAGGTGANAGRGGNGANGGNGGDKSCCEAGGGGGGGGGGAGGGGGGAGGGAGGPSIAVYHIGVGSLTLTASTQFRPVSPAAGGAGGALAAPATGGVGGQRGNCALIGGCAGGDHDGYSAAPGNLGPAGANGPAGQLWRVWNNGTTTF